MHPATLFATSKEDSSVVLVVAPGCQLQQTRKASAI